MAPSLLSSAKISIFNQISVKGAVNLIVLTRFYETNLLSVERKDTNFEQFYIEIVI